MIRRRPDNAEIADVLERVADLLEAEGGEPWRARAWRGGAATVRALEHPIVEILDAEGVKGLAQLPAIGKSLSAAIQELDATGHLGVLDRLETTLPPERLFRTVPGIGRDLASRIVASLGLKTLEELEVAAHDGRLDTVPGFGPRRVRAVKDALQALLGQGAARRARVIEKREAAKHEPKPPVALLLEVDRAYREAAEAGTLETIAPRRFNPEHQAWLPVLETERDGWRIRALFSNTARAHVLGTTHDWVVLAYSKGPYDGLATVVTEHHGPLAGRRVVRGREAECS